MSRLKLSVSDCAKTFREPPKKATASSRQIVVFKLLIVCQISELIATLRNKEC